MRGGPGRSTSAAPAKRSFPPVVDARARVLVLGTLPGEESLRRGEYYAHPRNLFWPIILALFDEPPALNYAERLAFLTTHRIAVWDVCEIGEREASADSTIRTERPNAIGRLLDQHPLIRAVAFNGTAALDESGACDDRFFRQACALDGTARNPRTGRAPMNGASG